MPGVIAADLEVGMKPRMAKKADYIKRLMGAFDDYDKAFLVDADNVGSRQLQEIRAACKKDSLLVFGKNSRMRKAILSKKADNPDLAPLVDHLSGNVGFVFTSGDLKEVRDRIATNKVPAPARANAVAQVGVTIPAGLTGMEPTQTSFFQALNIPTKINRGQIEIMSSVELFKPGEKVTSSHVALLAKMSIRPFSYGLTFKQVYDKGSLYAPEVLDITDDSLVAKVQEGIANIAALSLGTGRPTRASIPHSVMEGLKNLVAVSLVTDYVCEPAKKIKAILDDPDAMAAMAAAAAGQGAGSGEAEKQAVAEEEEEEEEEEEDIEFDLFD